jgi:hypothetical protein
MSGGMDIDWNYRDKILERAKVKFSNKTKEEIFDRSDELHKLENNLLTKIRNLEDEIRLLQNEQDEIYYYLKYKND